MYCCCCSVANSCPTLCDPMGCSTPGSYVFHSWNLFKFVATELLMLSNYFIICRSFLLLPSIFPNEFVLHIRWPKCWGFSFSISPSSECPGLISFRIDWLDLLAVQGTLKRLLQLHIMKASVLRCSAFFMVQLLYPYKTTGKTIGVILWTFVGFYTLSRFVITFIRRSNCLNFIMAISHKAQWFWSPRK